MLIGVDYKQPLYVIGQSPTANDIAQLISLEHRQCKNISVEEYQTLDPGSQCVFGLSNMEFRLDFFSKNNVDLHTWPIYIHPSCTVISPEYLERGVIVWPQCYLGHGVHVGEFSLISEICSLAHSCRVGNNCFLAPGVIVGGSTSIGKNNWIGQRSTLKDKIKTGNNITFCMTSVVTKDITESGKYFSNRRVSIDTE